MKRIKSDKNILKHYALGILLFLLSFNVFADGSAQIEQQGKPVKILINGGGSKFGGYMAAANEKINFYITNPSNESVYIGFGATFSGGTSTAIDAYYRIKNPSGTVVSGPELIKPSINSLGQASAGPFAGGGYAPIIFNPTDTGVYSLEINEKAGSVFSSQAILLNYLDITVADKGSKVVKPGRVFSKSWVLSTLNEATEVFSKFIVSPSLGTLYEIDLNGMRGAMINVFVNTTGPRATGKLSTDQLSIKKFAGYNASLNEVRYNLYLTSPDYLQGSFQNVVFSEKLRVDGCPFLKYTFTVRSSSPCFAEVFLDINGTAGFQERSSDLKYIVPLKDGSNGVKWDGIDGLEKDVSAGSNVKVQIRPIYGFANLPLFNIQSNPDGIIIKSLKTAVPTHKIYWDDELLYRSYQEFNKSVVIKNYEGCTGTSCHSWGDLIQDASGTKIPIGKDAVLNTWWYASGEGLEADFVLERLCIPQVVDDQDETKANTALRNTKLFVNDNYYSPHQIISANGTTEMGGNYVLDSLGFVYNPKTNFSGVDRFKYSVCLIEKPTLCATGLVTINVLPGPIVVTPKELLPEITIPSGFSPNDDGVNDYLRIKNIELYTDNKVKIYSRWGDLVYEGAGYDNENVKWVGTSSRTGLPGKLPAGTYYYVIDKGDGSDPMKSFIVLFR
ncbi:MAG TPA: gliding motility-associated C-terminal domain-containing protein [Cytophagaceae bacterium]|jgi:gliding motility-associated-like protein